MPATRKGIRERRRGGGLLWYARHAWNLHSILDPRPSIETRTLWQTCSCWRQIDTLFIAKTNEIGKYSYQKCCELGAAKRLNKQTIYSTLHFASLCVLQALLLLPLSLTSFCGESTERAQRCDFVPFCTPHSLHSTVHSLSLSLCSFQWVVVHTQKKKFVWLCVCVCWHWAVLLVHRESRRTVGQ